MPKIHPPFQLSSSKWSISGFKIIAEIRPTEVFGVTPGCRFCCFGRKSNPRNRCFCLHHVGKKNPCLGVGISDLTRYVNGWWLTYPSENMKVSWDDDVPNWMESHKIHIPNHQPAIVISSKNPTVHQVLPSQRGCRWRTHISTYPT